MKRKISPRELIRNPPTQRASWSPSPSGWPDSVLSFIAPERTSNSRPPLILQMENIMLRVSPRPPSTSGRARTLPRASHSLVFPLDAHCEFCNQGCAMADKLGPLGCDNLGLPLEATWQQRFQHLQPKEAGGTPPSADLLAGAKGHQGHGRGENLLLEAKGTSPCFRFGSVLHRPTWRPRFCPCNQKSWRWLDMFGFFKKKTTAA